MHCSTLTNTRVVLALAAVILLGASGRAQTTAINPGTASGLSSILRVYFAAESPRAIVHRPHRGWLQFFNYNNSRQKPAPFY